MPSHRVYSYKFAELYPLYIKKVERKGRTQQELDQVITWLTGYTDQTLKQQMTNEVDLETFFNQAPELNPNRKKITGVICGVRVENIEEPLMQEIRYLDLLVDELARGKSMERILRN